MSRVYVEIAKIAQELGVAVSTLRTWVIKYEHLKKLTCYHRKDRYYCLCVTEPEEFKRRHKAIVDNIKLEQLKNREIRKHNNGLSWTKSAIMCYENNGDCTICPNWDVICRKVVQGNGRPPMANTVERILSVWGEPPKQNNTESNNENDM